uniref:gamma-tubulin complex component 3-like n=1 Tax=Erigeron canadensis TaxID=72917 RepID=UPI001CB8E301|nr:gamma-tubulin complex component 3-like [Erigeron canadensis]XP_043636526.1 gamma-tubulin complex component 3-like [Erigeron canadensis]
MENTTTQIKDLINQLVHHLQTNPNPDPDPNPDPKDVKYALRILSSKMNPPILPNEATLSNSIKTQLAKQGKLSDALTFIDLYSKFVSKTGPGSVTHKKSLLYLLKTISEDKNSNPNVATLVNNHTLSSSDNGLVGNGLIGSKFRNGGVLGISRGWGDNASEIAVREFERLRKEEGSVLEEGLVNDVLDVCRGVEGKYVKFDENVDGFVVLDCFKVGKSTRIMVRKLCELGWLFRKVNGYIGDDKVGTVRKAFCGALEDEIVEYRKLMSVLKLEAMNPKGCLSLRRLVMWFVEPTVRMRRMAVLVDSCEDLKGGAMAGEIHLHAQHGDPLLHEFMKRLLQKVSSPLFEMVRSWVLEGELQDLYSEFFVSEESVKVESLWREGYRINELMLPSFISKSLANRILRTGKSINFLRVCCEDRSWADLATEAAALVGVTPRRGGLGYGETNELESLVAEAAKRIDKHLLHVIFNQYKFKEHCLAIKRYILLGQGDFVQYLMDIIEPELSEPAETISLIHYKGLLEKAIQSSSAQYHDHDNLDRLTVKLMPHKAGDRGWDVFSLYYDVRVPLNTAFTESVMSDYLRIFNFLWKIKRVEHAVRGAWKAMKPNSTTCDFINKLPKAVRSQITSTLKNWQVLWAEMNHFLSNLQSYIMLEVLEVTWDKFCNEMEAAKDLDDLIAAHDRYLATIVEKSLLGERSEVLYRTLLMLFDVILRFCSVTDRLYEGISEFEKRNTKNQTKAVNKSKSKGSEADSWLTEGRKAVTQRAGELFSNMGQDLDAVSKEYSSILKGFICRLPMQQHTDMKFLVFRLDFSEFYKLAA